MENKNGKKIDKMTIILLTVLVFGLCLIGYPSFADAWNRYHSYHAINSYTERLENIEDSKELYFQNVHKPLMGKDPSLKIYISFGEESEEKRKWHDLGISYTPSDHTWVGAKLGIYCLGSKGCLDPGYSDFYYVKTKEL